MDASVDAMVHCFLNVVETDVENPVTDPDGIIPFMTAPISSRSQMEKVKEDYHSNIDYEFILAPVSEEGGFAYLSPGDGIAINKNSDHVDWALEFLNFFFQEENNKLFAEEYDVIPNTSDAIAYVSKEFGIPEDQVCQLGDVTFDYNFYSIINETAMSIIKGNNPKYMRDDGAGNLSFQSDLL